MTHQHLVEVNRYAFSKGSLDDIRNNAYASNLWPLVYVLSDGREKRAYIGETTDTLTRMKTHLKHDEKSQLTTVHLISSDRFNKSATLDVESSLIQYMAADGQFTLLNSNLGLVDHNYYQKDDLYTQVFRVVWNKLRSEGVVVHSLESIDNSDLFKYSPYKSLSFDQRQGLLGIMYALLDDQVKNLVVQGGAGTGKSILAIFLFKLLQSSENDLNFQEFSSEEDELRGILEQLKNRYQKPKMALVVPMTSFRQTLKKAFRNIAGLSADMVISPSELTQQRYDIVLVDESHRLRKRVNLGAYYGAFDTACEALGFDKTRCSEVDWVCKQADKAVFFYDESQSIKPSDANAVDFDRLKSEATTREQTLVSQFRVRGGNAYVKFVDALLNVGLANGKQFNSKNYEFSLFDSIDEMVATIQEKNHQFGLSRLIAGYAWPWISKKDPNLFDIEIEDIQLRWNRTNTDWINAKNAEYEVGCIHTTQGYDLNYAGIIFGEEIGYDKNLRTIMIDEQKYFDRNGKQSITDANELKQYILNIYKTIMLRGIKGTFIYACNESLREYLAEHVPMHHSVAEKHQVKVIELRPFINSVPLYDLQAAAGGFSETQKAENKEWIEVSEGISLNKSMFACQVVGESMNKVIPNGSTCLFRTDPGGSRNGKIVLVELSDTTDGETGSHYTVKEYESFKEEDENGWHHQKILLKPLSYDEDFEVIEVTEDSSLYFRVIGEFLRVLE
ncbi:MAG: DNA/RNA helicase domain-containing protein [Mariprofundaceae bacterium]|nr:DNA/RNA helicase domain-containing protein [Mariprofundaceae bacterium]